MTFDFYAEIHKINSLVRFLASLVGKGHLPFLLSRADHNQYVNEAGALNRRAGQLQADIEELRERLLTAKANLTREA